MSLADDLEQAARMLRQTAHKYTTISTSFYQQAQGLSGLVDGLVNGADAWIGLSSDAFQLSWSRTDQDSVRIQGNLALAASHMTSLATTLEAQAPIIRSAQSIQQSAPNMPNATPQEVQDVHQMVQQAIQQEQNALTAIATMVSMMSDQLNEAASRVGFCSTGDKKKNPSPNDPLYAKKGRGGDDGEGGGSGKRPRKDTANQQENKDFLYAWDQIQRRLGKRLSRADRRRLHDEITKQGYTLDEIIEIGLSLFGD